jgi:anti-anti-sigma regulatory factor
MDAQALGELLKARAEIVNRGHRVDFVGAQGIVRRVFELSGLFELLDD